MFNNLLFSFHSQVSFGKRRSPGKTKEPPKLQFLYIQVWYFVCSIKHRNFQVIQVWPKKWDSLIFNIYLAVSLFFADPVYIIYTYVFRILFIVWTSRGTRRCPGDLILYHLWPGHLLYSGQPYAGEWTKWGSISKRSILIFNSLGGATNKQIWSPNPVGSILQVQLTCGRPLRGLLGKLRPPYVTPRVNGYPFPNFGQDHASRLAVHSYYTHTHTSVYIFIYKIIISKLQYILIYSFQISLMIYTFFDSLKLLLVYT